MSARDLLANATPRPWELRNGFTPLHGPETEEGYTDIIWAYEDANYAFRNNADGRLICAAVNEYEALLAVAESARAWSVAVFSGTDLDEWQTFKDALAHLDDLRASQ